VSSLVVGQALSGVVLPGALAAGVLVLGGRARSPRVATIAGACAAAIAYVAGEWALVGRPPFPPVDVTQWPFYLAPLLAALAAIEPFLARPAAVEWVERAIVSAAIAFLLLRPLSDGAPSTDMAAAAGLVLVAWGSLVVVARRLPAAPGFFAAAVLAGAASVVVYLSYSAFLAQMGGALAAGLGAGFLVALFGRTPPAAAVGAASVAGALVACLVVCGRHYASVPLAAALLLAAGPAVAAAIALLARSSVVARVAALLAIAGAGGGAVAIAFANHEASG